MPITATSLTTGSDATNATSYTTASITPSANKLVLVAVGAERSGGSSAPTISGNGITWTQVATVADATPVSRMTLFRGLSASPSAGSITIDFGAETQARCAWAVIEFTSVDTATNQGVVQNVTGSGNDNVGTQTITLAAFGSSNNATFGAANVERASLTDVIPGTGFTEVSQSAVVENMIVQTEFKNSEDTTVDWTWDGTGGAPRTLVAVEIKVSAAVGMDLRPLLGVG